MTEPSLVPPSFILVRPQMGENIGAAARAMLNFGLERMRIVAPRDGWPNPKAVAMASGAGRLLDNAGLFPSVQAAIADCDYVFATTARGRELVKPIVTPERAMEMARAMAATGKRVGVLFGPERAGLENEDVALAKAWAEAIMGGRNKLDELAQWPGLQKMVATMLRPAAPAPAPKPAMPPAPSPRIDASHGVTVVRKRRAA